MKSNQESMQSLDSSTLKDAPSPSPEYTIATLICENVYLRKALHQSSSKHTRLKEHLRYTQIALKTLHAQSYKDEEARTFINLITQQSEGLQALESTLDHQIQAMKDSEKDGLWLQTQIGYMNEENRALKVALEGSSNRWKAEIKSLRMENRRIMLESEPILEKNVKIERNMQDKIEEIASLELEVESKSREILALQQNLEKEKDTTKKLQLVVKEKDEQNKRLVDLCNKLEQNRTQLLKVQERLEEDRMNMEQEFIQATSRLKRIDEEKAEASRDKVERIQHLERQLEMYEEKMKLMEERLKLQENKASSKAESSLSSSVYAKYYSSTGSYRKPGLR